MPPAVAAAFTVAPPTGPRGNLLTGHLAAFRADRLAFFTRCAREHGDVVPLRLLGYRVLLLNRPDLIEQVLVTHAGRFVKHFGLRLYKPILGNGLVTSEGGLWRQQRKLSAPAFQASRMAGYADEMVDAAAQTADEWAAATSDAGPAAGGRDVYADMMRLTLGITCRTLFGADACPDPNVVGRAMEDGLAGIAARFAATVPLPTWVPTPANVRLRRAVAALRAVVAEMIARRRVAGPGGGKGLGPGGGTDLGTDLMALLIRGRDADGGTGMTDAQLVDEVLTILLAGHETTALALAYALYLLAANPAAQAALQAELHSVLGDRLPTYADLPRLTYAANVVTEAMRLYPPADFLGREAIDDCVVGGIPIRRGTNLFVSQWVMHRDGRYFPDPLRFDPGRWTPAFQASLPRFAYFPFGGGPRYCIGQTFATAEAVLVLAVLCRRFAFAPDPTFRLELDPGITLRPRAGVRVRVERSPS